MQKYIEEIYNHNKWELDMFGYDPMSCDDTKKDSYIYAWFTKNSAKKYFYVGKGKKDRYRHILWDIRAVENNSKKYKGRKYKVLKDNIGIDCEFLYINLTEREAVILEAYTMIEMYKNKQPLLNVIKSEAKRS